MGWEWGAPVKWCSLWGSDFCRFCVVVNRAFHILILHRNPTFINMRMPPGDKEKAPAVNGG
jgi:hypothetical protein